MISSGVFPLIWGLSLPSSLLQHSIFLIGYTFPLLREDTNDVISASVNTIESTVNISEKRYLPLGCNSKFHKQSCLLSDSVVQHSGFIYIPNASIISLTRRTRNRLRKNTSSFEFYGNCQHWFSRYPTNFTMNKSDLVLAPSRMSRQQHYIF